MSDLYSSDQLFYNDLSKLHERKVPISRTCSIATKRDGILQSRCTCEARLEHTGSNHLDHRCNLCSITSQLPKLHGLPEMLFHENYVRLDHMQSKAAIEFTAKDALKYIEETRDPLQVAVAGGWRSARADFPFASRIHKPYDWTYTSTYTGTLVDGERKDRNLPNEGEVAKVPISVEETTQRIDIEKLKKKEDIIFYDDITLYEDELADHGVSKFNVKVRAMPSGVYILARFYLRIDGVLVRINDTRIYHEYRKDYLIREFTNRESDIKSLSVPLAVLLEPNELMEHLPVIDSSVHKLTWPKI